MFLARASVLEPEQRTTYRFPNSGEPRIRFRGYMRSLGISQIDADALYNAG
jgi:hypothetical protein